MYGVMLNPIKLMGYCPTIAEGQAALGIESNGFRFVKDAGGPNEERGTRP
jgi:hypothetical protein